MPAMKDLSSSNASVAQAPSTRAADDATTWSGSAGLSRQSCAKISTTKSAGAAGAVRAAQAT